jgi:hypothetical protein
LLAVAELVGAALDEAAEALAPLDDESVDELEEAVDELEVDEGLAAVGRKVSLPTPKPIAGHRRRCLRRKSSFCHPGW